MKLLRLDAKHYRSLRDVSLEFSDLNLFIGANASGKSTLLDTLRFLQEAVQTRDFRAPVFSRGGIVHLAWKGKEAEQIHMSVRLEDGDKTWEWSVRLNRVGYEFHVEEHLEELSPDSPPVPNGNRLASPRKLTCAVSHHRIFSVLTAVELGNLGPEPSGGLLMIKHVVLVKLKPDASPEQIDNEVMRQDRGQLQLHDRDHSRHLLSWSMGPNLRRFIATDKFVILVRLGRRMRWRASGRASPTPGRRGRGKNQSAYAQQHLEAWYFGDTANLRAYLGHAPGNVDTSKPDEIENPKNHLKNVLDDRVYTARISEEIAMSLDPKTIAGRSPSFRGFLEAVKNGVSSREADGP